MGLFRDPNKKVAKVMKEIERKSGVSPSDYKQRRSCYNCKYFSSMGHCNYHKKTTKPQYICNDYWGK